MPNKDLYCILIVVRNGLVWSNFENIWWAQSGPRISNKYFLSEIFKNLNSFGIHAEFFQNSCWIYLEFFLNSFCCILPFYEKQKAVKFFKNSSRNSDQNSTHKSSQLCLMWLYQVWTTFFVNQLKLKCFISICFHHPL